VVREPPPGILGSWRYLGPGIVLSAAIVGSGELILTTLLGARVGLALMWVILLGCVLKTAVQIEYGRHSILHGVATLEAWSGPAVPGRRRFDLTLLLSALFFLTIMVGQAGVLGSAAEVLQRRFPLTPTPIAWTAILTLALGLLVFHGRYRPIERAALALNLVFVGFVIAAVVMTQGTRYAFSAADVGRGFIPSWSPGMLQEAIGAFGIIGVSAGEIIQYPTWCIEKGYARYAGPREDSDAWRRRARGWIRVMICDALFCLIVYTTATFGFYLLGATILHAQPDVTPSNFLTVLPKIFTEALGPGSDLLFVTGAFAVLYSTALANNGAYARLWTDLACVTGFLRPDRRRRSIAILACLQPLLWAALYLLVKAPVLFVIVMGVANALFLIVVGYKAVVFRYRGADPRMRPSTLYDAALWISIVSLAGMVALAVKDVVAKVNA
jgi:Mn2+/Fe2+ NRAMP family transporter